LKPIQIFLPVLLDPGLRQARQNKYGRLQYQYSCHGNPPFLSSGQFKGRLVQYVFRSPTRRIVFSYFSVNFILFFTTLTRPKAISCTLFPQKVDARDMKYIPTCFFSSFALWPVNSSPFIYTLPDVGSKGR